MTNAARLSVVLAGGTLNTLTDGASYSDTELKGALHSNDPLVISGAGALVVTGYYKHGIVGDDNIIIEGGNITIAAISDGIHANDDITVSDGTIHITQANDGLESEGTLLIEGGALIVTAQDDGIISQDTLTVSGGSVEIVSAVEGLESKSIIIINDGALNIEVSDDGLNATNDITINGGQIYINADGDAVDSNGTLNVNGGLMVALGGQMPEGGLDCDRCFIKFTGGTVVATGGDNSVPARASTQQVLVIGSRPTDSVLNIDPADTGTAVLNFRISKAYDQMIFSSPDLAAYTTYTANSGGSLSGGTDFHGLYTGAAYSGGSEWVTFTTDSVVTYVGIP